MIGYPYSSLLGTTAIIAIIAMTWWIEGMRVTIIAGLPWLEALTAAYFLERRRKK